MILMGDGKYETFMATEIFMIVIIIYSRNSRENKAENKIVEISKPIANFDNLLKYNWQRLFYHYSLSLQFMYMHNVRGTL